MKEGNDMLKQLLPEQRDGNERVRVTGAAGPSDRWIPLEFRDFRKNDYLLKHMKGWGKSEPILTKS